MVDTMRVARHSIVHKPPTGWIKHGNRVAERVKRASRGLTKTHSVASEAVGNCVRVCIAFRVWKQNLNAVLTDCLHLDNCTRSDSI